VSISEVCSGGMCCVEQRAILYNYGATCWVYIVSVVDKWNMGVDHRHNNAEIIILGMLREAPTSVPLSAKNPTYTGLESHLKLLVTGRRLTAWAVVRYIGFWGRCFEKYWGKNKVFQFRLVTSIIVLKWRTDECAQENHRLFWGTFCCSLPQQQVYNQPPARYLKRSDMEVYSRQCMTLSWVQSVPLIEHSLIWKDHL
jgi:hypothetical protein